MHPLAKALKATPDRKTRFHTARGELIGWRGIADLPVAVVRRLRPAPEPWMVRDAVRFLDRAIRPEWVVLELGSGASTAWFAARAKSVLSFENDPAWHHRVSAPANCRIELASLEDTLLRVQGMPDDSFDLVVVDSNEEPGIGRVDFARAAASKVRHGGLLVFDDLDREEHPAGDSLFADWEAHRFIGIKGQPLTTLETSIFRRT